jgi:Zn-dependent protease
MKWSWKIARIAGIDVFMHSTFLLLVAWVAISYVINGETLAAALEGVLFLLALFASVVLHEFGHALTARKYGIQTRDITLLPIGGVARLERMPEKPLEELRVALAGPVVTLVLAGLLFAGLLLTNTFQPLTSLTVTQGNFVERLMLTNLVLALFNLIPAFPMDGGRVVRALLATRLEYTRATQIAASLGQGIALILGLVGLFTNPFLLFIAFFVWIGAAQESSLTQMKSSLNNIPISRAMLTDFHTLSPLDRLSRPVELLLAGSQHDFPVVSDGQVVGILTRKDLVRWLNTEGDTMSVSRAMQKTFAVIDSSQMLEAIAQRPDLAAQGIIPVVHNASLVGLVTMENIGEFLMIQKALQARRAQP